MAISLACACGKQLRAKDEFAGKRLKCPKCGQILLVPKIPVLTLATPEPEPPAAPSPDLPPTCWFCKVGVPAPERSVLVVMIRETLSAQLRKVSEVPRCERCVKRRRIQYLAAAVLCVGGFAGLWGTAGHETELRVLLACVAIVVGIGLSLTWLLRDTLTLRSYPPIEQARRAGYRFRRPNE